MYNLPAIWLEQLDDPLPVMLTVFSLAKSCFIDLSNLWALFANRSLTTGDEDAPLGSSGSLAMCSFVFDSDEGSTLKYKKTNCLNYWWG